MDAIKKQNTPHGHGKDIASLVMTDVEARAQLGEKKYGERLLPNNGRDALVDAYQEALDLCMYLRQAIEERNTQIDFLNGWRLLNVGEVQQTGDEIYNAFDDSWTAISQKELSGPTEEHTVRGNDFPIRRKIVHIRK